jgi:hypothetical protein
MRGGAQSQLMLGADARLWVVKFQNNPQHLRVLANELIATRLAEALGLSVPASDVIEVTDWLATHTPDLFVDFGKGRRERCAAGLHFGSAFVGGLMPGQVVDFLPEPQLDDLRNHAEFAGMLALDKWTGNCNGRQAVFERKQRERKYSAIFIDQGFCFNAGDWDFPDSPLRGVYPRSSVYHRIHGWESFEPWLSRLETLNANQLWAIAEAVPPAWYGGDITTIEPDGTTPPSPHQRPRPHHGLQELHPRPIPKLEQARRCPRPRVIPGTRQYPEVRHVIHASPSARAYSGR